MKKEDIKENVDNMLIKVLEYIKACDLSDEDDFNIKLESAMSILMSAIDITDNPAKNLEYIIDQQANISTLITVTMTDIIKEIILHENFKEIN